MSNLKTTFGEFISEKKITSDKTFNWIDKSGRGERENNIKMSHILKTWDLDETDWTTDKTLREYLSDCVEDDVWETSTEKLTCIRLINTNV